VWLPLQRKRMFKNQNVVLGGSILLTLLGLGLGWFLFFRPTGKKPLTNGEKRELVDSAFKSNQRKGVEVEDEEEEDEVEEEEEEEFEDVVEEVIEKKISSVDVEEESDEDEDQEAALKQAYDDALRLAKKFLSGNQYTKAANKFSDAIDLAEKIPSAGKDIVTLYNNRRFLLDHFSCCNISLNYFFPSVQCTRSAMSSTSH
jgi:hypothetical protein